MRRNEKRLELVLAHAAADDDGSYEQVFACECFLPENKLGLLRGGSFLSISALYERPSVRTDHPVGELAERSLF